MEHPAALNFLFVAALMAVGYWLEGINGKHGYVDRFLTPLPLGIVGAVGTVILGKW